MPEAKEMEKKLSPHEILEHDIMHEVETKRQVKIIFPLITKFLVGFGAALLNRYSNGTLFGILHSNPLNELL